jgi:hypothetical protein
MKIDNQKQEVRKSSDLEEYSFKIEANSKAFDILSSKIYSNPRKAIVRELISNAWDAHIASNKRFKPFDIHIPISEEPFFSVRDFGKGMSHSEVMELYTTYFRSSKTETNEQIGCLGIGSKAPFSYTDTFSVTSWYGNKKRIYSMFKGKDGFPKVSFITEIDSNEPSGLEILFACEEKDISTFQLRLVDFLQTFPNPRPNLNIVEGFQIRKREVLLRGTNWAIYRNSNTNRIRMGCISYPLSREYIYNNNSVLQIRSLDINIPVGSVDIAANREELQYSDKTTKFLNSISRQIESEIIDKIQNRIFQCKTWWQAVSLHNEIFRKYRFLTNYRNNINQRISWKARGTNVEYGFPIPSKSMILYKKENQRTRQIVSKDKGIVSVKPSNRIKLMINDTKFNPDNRIKNWMKLTNQQEVLLVDLDKFQTENQLHSLLGTNSKEFKFVSYLPKLKTKNKNNNDTNKYLCNALFYNNFAFPVTESINILETEGLFARKIDYEIIMGDLTGSYTLLERIQTSINLIQTDIKNITIYAFNKRDINKIEKNNSKLQDAYKYSLDLLKNVLKEDNMKETIINFNDAYEMLRLISLEGTSIYLSKESPLKKYLTQIRDCSEIDNRTRNIIRFANMINYEFSKGIIHKTGKEIYKKYPLIKNLTYIHSNIKDKDIAEYINLIDQREKHKK